TGPLRCHSGNGAIADGPDCLFWWQAPGVLTFDVGPRSRSSAGERPPHTRQVTGSIPVGTTSHRRWSRRTWRFRLRRPAAADLGDRPADPDPAGVGVDVLNPESHEFAEAHPGAGQQVSTSFFKTEWTRRAGRGLGT